MHAHSKLQELRKNISKINTQHVSEMRAEEQETKTLNLKDKLLQQMEKKQTGDALLPNC